MSGDSSISGGLAQLGERLHGMQEVTGSIPVISTKKHRIWFRYGAFLFVAYGGNDDHYGLWERLFAVWWVECWVQPVCRTMQASFPTNWLQCSWQISKFLRGGMRADIDKYKIAPPAAFHAVMRDCLSREFSCLSLIDLSGQYRIILSADTASEVRQMLSQKRR